MIFVACNDLKIEKRYLNCINSAIETSFFLIFIEHLSLQLSIAGDVGEEFIGVIFEVNVTTIMVMSIRYNEVGGFEHHVVAHYLVKCFLRNPHRWRFVFYDYEWLCR